MLNPRLDHVQHALLKGLSTRGCGTAHVHMHCCPETKSKVRPKTKIRPERRRKQPFAHALNRGGIPPLPHTVDILPYDRDAGIDTKRNTVRRFMIAKYGMQETHSIVLIQRTI